MYLPRVAKKWKRILGHQQSIVVAWYWAIGLLARFFEVSRIRLRVARDRRSGASARPVTINGVGGCGHSLGGKTPTIPDREESRCCSVRHAGAGSPVRGRGRPLAGEHSNACSDFRETDPLNLRRFGTPGTVSEISQGYARSLLQECQLRCRRPTLDINTASPRAVASFGDRSSVISRAVDRRYSGSGEPPDFRNRPSDSRFAITVRLDFDWQEVPRQ